MTTLAPPATIAFIGLGMMGRPMAARLAEAGFKLRLFDVSQKAVSDFVGAHPSALATASPKAAAQGADALITMLPDGKIVRQALIEGRDAAREGLAAGALVLDMSSSNPVDTQKLARDLAASGVALLDAPVSGGVKRAIDGSLSIMVGGAAADLERARPALRRHGQDHHAVRAGRRGPCAEGAEQLPVGGGPGRDVRGAGGGRGVRPRSRHHGRRVQQLDRQEQRHRGQGPPVRGLAQPSPPASPPA